jgi:CubicO group peptidase (beta-lactamase class C family)
MLAMIAVALVANGCGLTMAPGRTSSPEAGSSRSMTPASPTAATSPDLGDELDAMVARFQGFQGSALVALGDEVLLSKGYGMADTETGIANAPETRFRLGSITKQFTAMAILILQSQGKLDISDAACEYIADCPPAWKPITIRQLLSHTSGLPNFTDLPGFAAIKNVPSTPAQTLERIADLPLDFTPGERFSYSNTGYIALGEIIEQVSGMPYEDFLQKEIFGPLEMRDTGYDTGDDGLAVGYKSATSVADTIDMSVPHAAGGLYSTILDLYRWDQALYTDRLLPQDLLATMFEPAPATTDIGGFGYGYGFAIGTAASRPWVFHDGGIEGFQTHYGRHPDDRLSVIILSNREDIWGYDQLDRTITDLVLDR